MGENEQMSSEEDLLAAAVDAQCKEFERKTGQPREVMWAKLSDRERISVQEAQDHHNARMRKLGRSGY